MREFRFLEEKRKRGGLSSGEEARWSELRGVLGAPQAPPPAAPPPQPQGYWASDGQWYPYPYPAAPGYAPAQPWAPEYAPPADAATQDPAQAYAAYAAAYAQPQQPQGYWASDGQWYPYPADYGQHALDAAQAYAAQGGDPAQAYAAYAPHDPSQASYAAYAPQESDPALGYAPAAEPSGAQDWATGAGDAPLPGTAAPPWQQAALVPPAPENLSLAGDDIDIPALHEPDPWGQVPPAPAFTAPPAEAPAPADAAAAHETPDPAASFADLNGELADPPAARLDASGPSGAHAHALPDAPLEAQHLEPLALPAPYLAAPEDAPPCAPEDTTGDGAALALEEMPEAEAEALPPGTPLLVLDAAPPAEALVELPSAEAQAPVAVEESGDWVVSAPALADPAEQVRTLDGLPAAGEVEDVPEMSVEAAALEFLSVEPPATDAAPLDGEALDPAEPLAAADAPGDEALPAEEMAVAAPAPDEALPAVDVGSEALPSLDAGSAQEAWAADGPQLPALDAQEMGETARWEEATQAATRFAEEPPATDDLLALPSEPADVARWEEATAQAAAAAEDVPLPEAALDIAGHEGAAPVGDTDPSLAWDAGALPEADALDVTEEPGEALAAAEPLLLAEPLPAAEPLLAAAPPLPPEPDAVPLAHAGSAAEALASALPAQEADGVLAPEAGEAPADEADIPLAVESPEQQAQAALTDEWASAPLAVEPGAAHAADAPTADGLEDPAAGQLLPLPEEQAMPPEAGSTAEGAAAQALPTWESHDTSGWSAPGADAAQPLAADTPPGWEGASAAQPLPVAPGDEALAADTDTFEMEELGAELVDEGEVQAPADLGAPAEVSLELQHVQVAPDVHVQTLEVAGPEPVAFPEAAPQPFPVDEAADLGGSPTDAVPLAAASDFLVAGEGEGASGESATGLPEDIALEAAPPLVPAPVEDFSGEPGQPPAEAGGWDTPLVPASAEAAHGWGEAPGAEPVGAEPVMADPLAAGPEPFAAEPVAAEPGVAEPFAVAGPVPEWGPPESAPLPEAVAQPDGWDDPNTPIIELTADAISEPEPTVDAAAEAQWPATDAAAAGGWTPVPPDEGDALPADPAWAQAPASAGAAATGWDAPATGEAALPAWEPPAWEPPAWAPAAVAPLAIEWAPAEPGVAPAAASLAPAPELEVSVEWAPPAEPLLAAAPETPAPAPAEWAGPEVEVDTGFGAPVWQESPPEAHAAAGALPEPALADIELVEDAGEPPPPPAVAPMGAGLLATSLAPEPFEAPEVALAAGAAPSAFVPGEHRVILHTLEGQVKRGTLRDADLLGESILLEQQAGFAPERIPTERLKAVFYMLPTGSVPPPPAGTRLRVTFIDGRQVAGFSEDFHGMAAGFFVVPADTRTNTARIFVYRASVQAVAEG